MRLRREGLIWRNAGDEVVALDLTRSEYLASNRTAAVLWEALAEGADHESLVQLLCARFDVAPEVARGDVGRLLEWLAAEGLLEDD
jgi:Coenzyme PQQ synthesis protein D (PqqD)